jgi:hypothetical protein
MVDAGLSRGSVYAALAVAGGLGCAASSAASSPAPNAPAAPLATATSGSTSAETGFRDGFRLIEARGQGLTFPLPDPRGWRLDAKETHSWVARHSRSASELVVRAWQFDDIARPEDCEREARSRRPELPELQPSELVESGAKTLADGYRGHLSVGVREASPGSSELRGYALGFGSDARRCLMLAFSTTAQGPLARRVVAERLSTVTHSVFEHAHQLDIESRVDVPRR